MLATTVSAEKELDQIIHLSQQNAKTAVSPEDKVSEGFISWTYTPELLHQLHKLQPGIIVKDGETLAGYALVALKEAANFHKDLDAMICQLDQLPYGGKVLADYRYYVMGQICIDKAFRGQGIFDKLYAGHKEIYNQNYDCIVTEVATRNTRSLRAHQRVGFNTIHKHTDETEDWEVMVWDWS